MKKLFGVLFISLTLTVAAFAVDAEVTYIKGKVEVQRGNQWIALQVGDKVAQSEMISTGFQSEAKVKLIDSIMCLGPVTRVTLEELSAGKTQDKVNVYLKTGSVRSQVNHTEAKRVNYQVHTAIAVASARGTDYTLFDSNETVVTEGVVAVGVYTMPSSVSSGSEEAASESESENNSESESNTDAEASASSVPEAEPPALESTGVLVRQNQSIKVSNTGSVAAPVNTVVQSASSVISATSTAASKDSVQTGSATVSTPAAVIVESTPEPDVVIVDPVEVIKKGTVNIIIQMPEE